MPYKPSKLDVLKLLNVLNTESSKDKKIFRKEIRMHKKESCKLALISFLTKKPQSKIIYNILTEYITSFEKKHGNVQNLAKEHLEQTEEKK